MHHIHSTAVALSAPPRGPLDDIAAATRNASRLRGSDALFNAMTIDSRSNLGTNHAIFLICHRLTLPLPFLSPPFYCHPDCKHLPQPPSRYQGPLVIDGSHNLFQHGYHQAQCPKHWCPTTRHNQWIDSVVKDLRKWAGVVCQVAQQLYHSENNNRTVDLMVHRPDRPSEPATMADPTIFCPMLPAHSSKAASDIAACILAIHKGKSDKHHAGCTAAGRTFLPVVITTLGGVGNTDWWDYWDVLWRDAITSHCQKGGLRHEATFAKQQAAAHAQAVLTRHTADAIILLAPPRTSTQASPRTSHPGNQPRVRPINLVVHARSFR